MAERDLPLPTPERNPYWDPHPLRCPTEGCRSILQAKGDGMGWCPFHGIVKGVYLETESFQFGDDE